MAVAVFYHLDQKFGVLTQILIEHIMSKGNVLLAIHNFSEMKSLANNAKIRSSLKFLRIRYDIQLHANRNDSESEEHT